MIFDNGFVFGYVPKAEEKEQGNCNQCQHPRQMEDYLICDKYRMITERNKTCKSWEKNKDGKE